MPDSLRERGEAEGEHRNDFRPPPTNSPLEIQPAGVANTRHSGQCFLTWRMPRGEIDSSAMTSQRAPLRHTGLTLHIIFHCPARSGGFTERTFRHP
eukprot:5200438-Pleurochrysis_carterae.AAC.1